MTEIVSDQQLKSESPTPDQDEYRQLCEILIDAIPRDRTHSWAGKILHYLATETMQALAAGNDIPRISTKAIHLDVGGNPNQQPSAWLSPLWNDIEERHYPEIEPVLIDACREAGLSSYPTLAKDHGKPAYYRIDAKPLPSAPALPINHAEHPTTHVVQYKRDLSLKLSWAGKLVFSNGLRWTPFKRFSYITWQVLSLIALFIFDALLWLLLWFSTPPIAGQELVLLSLAIGVPIVAYPHFRDIFRLFEDRIMIAPEWALAIKEVGATIEINRSRHPDEDSTILVQRYTAICPTCGWMIKLDQGKPDFPRRLVGRCEEHPREHVFSFDRMTKLGKPLGDNFEHPAR